VVSFMSQLIYPKGKSPRYPLNRRLGGPQNQSGCGGKEIEIPSLSLPRIEPCCPVHSLMSVLNELPGSS
jgi:hypothetical protein